MMTSPNATRKASNSTAPRFASAATTSTADELLGVLAMYRPIEVKSFETRVGTSDATICQVVTVGDDGAGTGVGERPIFWQVVRRQVAGATPATPWVAGRLRLSGNAYVLDALDEADTALVETALASLED